MEVGGSFQDDFAADHRNWNAIGRYVGLGIESSDDAITKTYERPRTAFLNLIMSSSGPDGVSDDPQALDKPSGPYLIVDLRNLGLLTLRVNSKR